VHNLRVPLNHMSPHSQYDTAKSPTLLRSTSFRIGLFLLVLAALSVLGLFVTTDREQALSPGEKSLGVAALFILWSLPIASLGILGVCFLVASTTMFLYRKFRKGGSSNRGF